MTRATPINTGAALAITAGVGYAACAVAFYLFPDSAVNFMNALFHGLDFRKLQTGPALFSFGSFGYALVLMMAWAFGLGAIFGWVLDRVRGQA